MQIKPQEIHSIEDAGMLDNAPVKMIRTKGGFYIAVGKARGKAQEEALAAGSHPAIVKYNMEKQYPQFQPVMMKSEANIAPVVDKHSHFLSDELRKSGHDIYSIQNGPTVDFQITKQNFKVASVKGVFQNEELVLRNLNMSKEFAKALAGATTEKALSGGAKSNRLE